MPTNLPPEYYNIEEMYRVAGTPQEKIMYLEEMMAVIPKHKGTDKLRAELRKKLSKLKDSVVSQKGGSRQISPYVIEREGAGQVALIGPTNVGKSSLIRALTNANPQVADYPFTTQIPIPGMMQVDNVQIQLIDTPPLGREYEDPQLLDLVRRADMMVLVIDLQGQTITQLEESLELLQEHRIIPLHMKDQYTGERRAYFKPLLVLVNKTDNENLDEDFEVLCELLEGGPECPLIAVSADTGRNFELFQQAVYNGLGIMRIYSKPPGTEPNLNAPFVLKKGSTVEEFAAKVHKDFVKNLKSARIWGSGTFEGQKVSRDYELHDGDIVELRD
jgi:small GTP-binding protein